MFIPKEWWFRLKTLNGSLLPTDQNSYEYGIPVLLSSLINNLPLPYPWLSNSIKTVHVNSLCSPNRPCTTLLFQAFDNNAPNPRKSSFYSLFTPILATTKSFCNTSMTLFRSHFLNLSKAILPGPVFRDLYYYSFINSSYTVFLNIIICLFCLSYLWSLSVLRML